MSVFIIERNFAEELNMSPDIAAVVNKNNMEAGVQWIISFLSADKKKTYCLYEAPSIEAVREAAVKSGLPADVIVEVTECHAAGTLSEVQKERFV